MPEKDATMKLYEGNRLFLNGSHKEAEKIFERLLNSENPGIARGALYGLACTGFMLAESRAEQREAAGLLEQWWALSSDPVGSEDPRMLLSAISKATHRRPIDGDEKPDDIESSDSSLLMRLLDYETENDKLKQRLADMTTRLQAAASENAAMRAMEKELETLRNQIRTIESIDQKIQEKKQGISSP